MKNSIYSKRVYLNNWEILGIIEYLKSEFNIIDGLVYADKTLHLDVENKRFGIYKISHSGDDLYFTIFNDESENKTFRLNLINDSFDRITEDFDYIDSSMDIFNI